MALLWVSASAIAGDKISITQKKTGKTIEVVPVDVDEKEFSFRIKTIGRVYKLPVEDLDTASRVTVRNWEKLGHHLSTDYEIDVNTGRSRNFGNRYNYDDSSVVLEPEVTVKNSRTSTTRSGAITILFLGRSVIERSALYVYTMETFDLPQIGQSESKVFKMKRGRWDYDDNYPYVFGARYLGYVVIIHDPKTGEVLHAKSVPSALVKDQDSKYLKLQTGTYYDDDTLDQAIVPYSN